MRERERGRTVGGGVGRKSGGSAGGRWFGICLYKYGESDTWGVVEKGTENGQQQGNGANQQIGLDGVIRRCVRGGRPGEWRAPSPTSRDKFLN